MSDAPAPSSITTLPLGGRIVHLLGTAHISAESCAEVERAIHELKPDVVLVELDPGRLASLRDPDTWKKTDVRKVLRDGQLPTLIAGLVLAAYQRRLGGQTGVRPGAELLRAVTVAEATGLPVLLGDRPIRKTLRRVWGSLGLWRRYALLMSLLAMLFTRNKVTEADLSALKKPDALNLMLAEMGATMPELAQSLVTERDWYMAEGIQASTGSTILAVVGAAHVPGMTEALRTGRRSSLAELEAEPVPSLSIRLLPWALAALVVGALTWFIATRWNSNHTAVLDAARLWILCTSGPALVAGVIARAHPLVLLLIVVVAPVATLLRAIPGPKLSLLSAMLQAYLRPPTVEDMESVADQIGSLRAWWSNRLLRLFLVFVLPGLASTLGALWALSVIVRAS